MPERHEYEAFTTAYVGARAIGTPFVAALEQAARSALSAYVMPEALACVVGNLALDFDRAHGTATRDDATCISRLVEAYLKLGPELSVSDRTTVNLPFFTSVASGPLHLERSLTRAQLAELTRRVPDEREIEPALPEREPEAESPKKKSRWRFW